MGIARGPNVINDGLVFGYDTGYPISYNAVATRFYPGAPVTNLNTDPYHSTKSAGDTVSLSAWGGDTGQGSFEVNTSPDGGGMMFINHNTSDPAGTGGTYTDFPSTRYTLTNGVTYTRSWWCKADRILSYVSAHICSCNRDSDNTYITGPNISLNQTWQRFSSTFTYTGTTSTDWQFRHINYNASKIYIANVQLEVNGFASPFVDGSRSDTASLIDLKRTASIDVGDVSFNSTGQPEFDGTNDKIVIPNKTSIDYYTYETVVKINSSDTSYSGFGSNFKSDASGYSGVGNGWVIRLDPNGALQVYTKNNSTTLINPINISGFRAANVNNYIHLVYTYSNGSNKLYVDGVLQATGTALSGTTPSDSTLIIGAYSWGISSQTYYINAHQPVAKLYNTALTVAEINSNFNANKNRFNI